MWGASHLSMARPNLKFKIYGGRVGHLSMSSWNQISNFWWGWGICHLFMSRPNLKFKNVQWGLGVQAKSEIYIVWWGRGLVIFPCPGQIWNLKFSVRVGGQSSFHVQTKAEISIFQQRLDGWSSYHTQAKSEIWNFSIGEGSVTFLMSRNNLKFKIFGGRIGHLSMSRQKSYI